MHLSWFISVLQWIHSFFSTLFFQVQSSANLTGGLSQPAMVSYLGLAVLLILRIAIAGYIWTAARKRGENRWVWTGLVLLSVFLGLILWWALALRRRGKDIYQPREEVLDKGYVLEPYAQSFLRSRISRLFRDPLSPLMVIILLFGTRFLGGTFLSYPILSLAIIFPNYEVGGSLAEMETMFFTPSSILILTIYENLTMVLLLYLAIVRTGVLRFSAFNLSFDNRAGNIAREVMTGLAVGGVLFFTMSILSYWSMVGAGAFPDLNAAILPIIVASCIIFGSLLAGMYWIGCVTPRSKDSQKCPGRTLLIWVVGLVLATLLMIGLGAIIPPEDAQLPMPGSSFDFIYLFIAVAIIAPVAEEFFFRGYAFTATERRGRVMAAYLFSAALFALVHFLWLSLIPIFITGLVLAHVVARTRSLVPAIIAHFLNNFVVLLVLAFGL